MIIGIDCRLSGKKHAGIGRYISNLVLNLVKLDHENHYILFFYDQEQANELVIKSDYVQTVIVGIPHYSLLEQLKLPFIFAKYQLDLLHVPHFNAPILYFGKTILTIHDLLWHQRKGADVTTLSSWKYYLKYLGYRLVSSLAIKKASKILVPTLTIKKTLVNFYPTTKDKVVVTKEGIDQSFFNHKPLPITHSDFLLYVGSLYPHKNIDLVLKGLQKLPAMKLKIVGARNVFVAQLKQKVNKLNLSDQVEFLGFVKDEQLVKLYQQSLALVQPSLSEGFGLTGVEAMAAGGLVLASDIPVFKEVYQDHAIYFDPQDVDSFIQAILQLQKTKRQNMIKENLVFAKTFDWRQMAKQTLAQYQAILKR